MAANCDLTMCCSALRTEIRAFLRFVEGAPTARPFVLDEVNERGFVRKLIAYTGDDGEVVQAFLFEPTAGRAAAAVVLHQHNSDWSLGKSEVAGAGR